MKTLPLYAGLDVHQEFTVGTVVDEMGNAVRELKVPTDEQGYKRLFYELQNVTAVFEAGRNWSYIANLLKPYCTFKMAHPLKVRLIASARIKTDEIDSRTLAHLLRTNLIPESYMPSDSIVELRNLVRYRVRIGRMATHLKNRTHDILAREGHKSDFKKPYQKKAMLWIQNLKMNPVNRDELDYTLKLLNELEDKIKELDEKLEKERIKYPEANLLTTIPGIATYSALLILAEVGDFSRFPSADKLAAYSGLVSSTHQSGNRCYQGRITKQGNVWLRWILTQCAHASVKKQHRLQKFYLRIKHRRGEQKAITATARKMLTTIWYMLQRNEAYHG